MILRRRVFLDGAALDEADPRILIQAIEPAAGKDSMSAAALGDGYGSRMTEEHRDSLDIAVRFSINEKSYRPEERAEALERALAWAAKGGWLTVNYKPGRRIRVIPAQLPGEGDAADRGTQYTITFRAYGNPWWQETEPDPETATGSSADLTLPAFGSRETEIEFTFRNTSGSTVDTLTVKVTDPDGKVSSMSFTGLGLGSGETLRADHEDNGRRRIQRIRIRNAADTEWRSAMAARTGSDELRTAPGNARVQMTAGGAGEFAAWAFGRFA